MSEKKDENVEAFLQEILQEPKTREDVSKRKLQTREQVIARLTTLLSISFNKGLANPGRGGLPSRQKWFSISASLAHTLALLVRDLEYERLRLDVDRLKKKVLEEDVTSQSRALS